MRTKRSPITGLARDLRKDGTEAERRLWYHLRNRQLQGFKFRRQWPVGRHIADFACLEAGLIVEVDGGQHADRAIQDEARSAELAEAGFRVVRFWNNEVLGQTEAVLGVILEALLAAPHPNPLPAARGEGT